MNDYYVYIYWRLDTNEVFYVGKGKGDRWRVLNPSKRNKHFMNIINKIPIMCEIIKNNLTEGEAFYWEEKIIEILVFEYGYSIDIPNNKSREKGCHLVNCTWGGEGVSRFHTEEENKKQSKRMKGENNPNYGKHHSKETKQKISKSKKGKYLGENNPNYGKHWPKEVKDSMSKKAKERFKNKENHPSYGKRGKYNTKSKSVICLTTKRIFYSTREAERYYRCNNIYACCNGSYKTVGKLPNGTKLIWRWLIWNHNKIYRIKK